MSEALYLFTMLLTARYLLRWLRDGRVRWLVLSGVALGFAYLARNEAAGAGIFGAAVVATVSFSRAGGALRSRLATAVSDTAIFILPFITSFAGWAIASFVIIGSRSRSSHRSMGPAHRCGWLPAPAWATRTWPGSSWRFMPFSPLHLCCHLSS